MIRTLARIFRRTSWLNDNAGINYILKKIVFPLYLACTEGKITTDGMVLFVQPCDHKGVLTYAHSILHGNIYIEPFEVELFTSVLQANENLLVIDVGANYGMYTLAACVSSCFNHSPSVIAIEADSSVFACLEKSVSHNGFSDRVRLVNAGASDIHRGKCTIYKHKTQSSYNVTSDFSNGVQSANYINSGELDTVTIDGVIADSGEVFEKLLVKIDVEGNEIKVIKGMQRALSSNAGYAIFCEYALGTMAITGVEPLEFLETLFSIPSAIVYEIDDSTHKLVRYHDPLSFISQGKSLTNLLATCNMNIPERFISAS